MWAGRSMRWTADGETFETVAQCVYVVQQKAFTAVAAGVVIHQHTRMLMADLRERADGMQVQDVRAGLSQLSAEMSAAYKAAGVGRAELRRVGEEYSSGPEGRAAIHKRVADANSRIAETLCGCAVCARAAVSVRGQSRVPVANGEHYGVAAAVVKHRAAGTGCQETRAVVAQPRQSTQSSAAVDGLILGSRKDKEKQRKKRQRAKKKMQKMQEAALGADAAANVQTGVDNEAGAAADVQTGHSGSEILQKIFRDTSVSGFARVDQIQAYDETQMEYFECPEWPTDGGEASGGEMAKAAAAAAQQEAAAAAQQEAAAATAAQQEAEAAAAAASC